MKKTDEILETDVVLINVKTNSSIVIVIPTNKSKLKSYRVIKSRSKDVPFKQPFPDKSQKPILTEEAKAIILKFRELFKESLVYNDLASVLRQSKDYRLTSRGTMLCFGEWKVYFILRTNFYGTLFVRDEILIDNQARSKKYSDRLKSFQIEL